MGKRPLRVLTPQEQREVHSVFRLMAVALGQQTQVVLARNRYVEATIAELLETVPDKLLLLTAWITWFNNREDAGTLREVQWHVTQFQNELDGALAAADGDFKRFQTFPKDVLHYNTAPVCVAYHLLQGGAR